MNWYGRCSGILGTRRRNYDLMCITRSLIEQVWQMRMQAGWDLAEWEEEDTEDELEPDADTDDEAEDGEEEVGAGENAA